MSQNIYTYIIETYFILLLLYFVGTLLCGFFSDNTRLDFNTFFKRVILGLSSSVVILAIYFTAFRTVYIGSFLIVVFLIKERFSFSRFKTIGLHSLFYFIILLIPSVFFVVCIDYVTNIPNSNWIMPHRDVYFYSSVSSFIEKTGNELYNHPYNTIVNPSFKGVQAYHYFELWLNVIPNTLFYQNTSLYNFMFVTTPVLLSVIYLGVLTIGEHFKINGYINVVIGLLLMGVSSIYYDCYAFIPKMEISKNYCKSGLFLYPWKAGSWYVFLLLSCVFFIEKKKNEALTSLMFLTLSSVVFFPILFFLGVVVGGGELFFYRKKRIILNVLGFSVFYGAFFLLFKNNEIRIVQTVSLIDVFKNFDFKLCLNITVGAILHCFLGNFLILIPLVFNKKNREELLKYKLGLSYSLMIIFASIIVWGILGNILFDIKQITRLTFFSISFVWTVFFFYFYLKCLFRRGQKIVVYSSISFVLVIYLLSSVKTYKTLFLQDDIMLIYNYFGSKVDDEYVSKISQHTFNNENKVGYVRNFNKKDLTILSMNPNVAQIGLEMGLISDELYPIDLTVLHYPKVMTKDSLQQTNGNSYSLMGQYIVHQKDIDKDELQWRFIQEYHIKYIFVEDSAYLSQQIQEHVVDEYVDEINNNRFLILYSKIGFKEAD